MKVTALSRRQFGIHPHLAEGMISLGQTQPYVTRVWMCHLLEPKYTETCANKPKSFLVPFSFEIVCQVLDVNLFRVP